MKPKMEWDTQIIINPRALKLNKSMASAVKKHYKDTGWFSEEYNGGSGMRLKVKKHLLSTTSDYQKIDIFDSVKPWGRVLALDNTFQLTTGDQHYYHEMIVHPVMSRHPSPKNVLIIGGGDGGTAMEVLRYPEVQSVSLIEIDPLVVEVCKEYFPTLCNWADPRLEVRYEDGAKFIKNFHKKDYSANFDVIIIDSSDPVGPSEVLFDRKFYKNCIKALTENGILITQSGSPFTQRKEFIRIVKTLRKEFYTVWPYFGTVPIYGAGPWSWTWASVRVSSGPHMAIVRNPVGVKLWTPWLDHAAFDSISAELRKTLGM